MLIITPEIEKEARKLLKEEKEIICLDQTSYIFYNMIGLDMSLKGIYPLAKLKLKK